MLVWRFINILSIDIALGAVAGCAFFASLLSVSLLPQAYLSLGLIVWIVYTVDHLLDACRDIESLSTYRHRFHRQHRKWLTGLVLVSALLVLLQAFSVRKPVLISGLTVGAFVVAYLLLQRHLAFVKEAAGALLYTAGVVIAPASLSPQGLASGHWLLIIIFALTAYGNLMLCSLYDLQTDLNDNHRSFATIFGSHSTRVAIVLTFFTIAVLLAISAFQPVTNLGALAILGLMNGMLAVIFLNKTYYAHADRHRLMADMVFILPVVYLLLDGAQWL